MTHTTTTRTIQRNRRQAKGQTLAEYGLIIALIAVFSIAALTTLGGNIQSALNTLGSTIQGTVSTAAG